MVLVPRLTLLYYTDGRTFSEYNLLEFIKSLKMLISLKPIILLIESYLTK